MERLFIINEKGYTLPDTPCILPQKVFQDLISANDILENAKENSRQIEAQAKALYEEERVRGYEEGMQESKDALAEKMFDIIAERVNYLENIEKDVIQLVMDSLSKILDELPPQEKIINIVKKAIVYVRNQKKVTLRISPVDEVYVQNALQNLQKEFPAIEVLDIFPDKRLSEGDCVLESGLGILDASLKTQIQNIERAFMKNISDTGKKNSL